jgi:hypothetical protein
MIYEYHYNCKSDDEYYPHLFGMGKSLQEEILSKMRPTGAQSRIRNSAQILRK